MRQDRSTGRHPARVDAGATRPPAPRRNAPPSRRLRAAVGLLVLAGATPALARASREAPPHETGLGAWTEKDFIATIRNGRHLGRGRPLMPPMPWFNYREATDEDLKAIFAYLRSIPAVKNRVPDPRPPASGPTTASSETR